MTINLQWMIVQRFCLLLMFDNMICNNLLKVLVGSLFFFVIKNHSLRYPEPFCFDGLHMDIGLVCWLCWDLTCEGWVA